MGTASILVLRDGSTPDLGTASRFRKSKAVFVLPEVFVFWWLDPRKLLCGLFIPVGHEESKDSFLTILSEAAFDMRRYFVSSVAHISCQLLIVEKLSPLSMLNFCSI
jgi:hypothetical protein